MLTATVHGSVNREIGTALRHTFMYGVGGMLTKAISFFMLPFYTHYLTPYDYGVLEIIDLTMTCLAMFLNMGITAAVLRYYASAQTTAEKRSVISTALLCVGATAAISYVIGLSVAKPVSAILLGPTVPSWYLLLAFSSFILLYVTNLPRTYLRALEASGVIISIENIALILLLALNVYFIAVLKMGLAGILWSSFLVAALQAIGLLVWTFRNVGVSFDGSYLWQMARFGLPLIASNLAMFVLNFSDRIFLQRLTSLAAVGIYAVGYKFGFLLNYVFVQAFLTMWQSRMYIVYAHPDYRQIFARIFVLYSLLLIYAGLSLSVFSPELVRVMLDPQFAQSQEVIPIVALAYVVYGIGVYLQLGMLLMNKTGRLGAVGAIAAVITLALNYLLIFYLGVIGAAWATVLGFGVLALGGYYCSRRVFPIYLGERRVLAAFLLAGALYVLCRRWGAESFGLLLLVKSGVIAGFPILLWKSGILSADERSTVMVAKDYALCTASRIWALRFGRAATL
jgi:O-antigen/teichoic acid export membrane protein